MKPVFGSHLLLLLWATVSQAWNAASIWGMGPEADGVAPHFRDIANVIFQPHAAGADHGLHNMSVAKLETNAEGLYPLMWTEPREEFKKHGQ